MGDLAEEWQARWRRQAVGGPADLPWPADEARALLGTVLVALDAAGDAEPPAPERSGSAGAAVSEHSGSAEPPAPEHSGSAEPPPPEHSGSAGAAVSAMDAAAARWASAGLPVDCMIGQLGVLRDLLADQGGRWPDADVRGAVDRLTTVVTETVLDAVHDAARTDPLTGVGNRRAMLEAARPALAAARRSGNALAVVAIDVVGLKSLNDTEGHAAGDRALADLTGSLRGALRHSDQLFRVGGDEFVAVLPLVGPADVAEIMARAGADGAPRFSWGLALVPDDGTTLEELLAVADRRLYDARRSPGRAGGQPGPAVAGAAGVATHPGAGRRRAARRRRLGRRRRGDEAGGGHAGPVVAAGTPTGAEPVP